MAYHSLVTEDFCDTPYLGTLPLDVNKVKTYNLKQFLPPGQKISEVLIYGFFSSLPRKTKGPIVRSVYELYTTTVVEGASRYSQFMNATFNQPDTVINSINLWLPYTDGLLRARLPATWSSGPIPQADVDRLKQHAFKNLDEAMKAFAEDNDDTIFCDLFLLGYRLAV